MPVRGRVAMIRYVARVVGERAQAIVELALLLPILVVIVMGAIDLGRVYFAYTSVVNAAREGAVCASLRTACTIGVVGAVTAEVGPDMAARVTAVTNPSPVGAPGTNVTVTVSHDFQSVTTAILSTDTFPISASATMVVQ